MKILDAGYVFRSQPGTNRSSCSFPGITITSTGRWVCTFRTAPHKSQLTGQNVALCWSDDAGTTWTKPTEPFQVPEGEAAKGSLRTGHVTALANGELRAILSWTDSSDPSLPFFNEETEGLLDTWIYQSTSNDNGETWSELTRVDTSPFHVPTPTTGPLLELNDKLLICQFELNKPYLDPTPWEHRSVLKFSRDGGKTWPDHAVVSDDPTARFFYWDQRPGVTGQNEILDLFWSFDRQTGQYLNIHARRSSNAGSTWSAMWDTGVPGQPATPVRLTDGRIAMVYVDREHEPVIKLRISDDAGHTWPDETELVLFEQTREQTNQDTQSMQDAWAEMYDFALGLPATTELPDGDLLVVFYEGPRGDETSIRWVRLGLLEN